VLGREAPRCYEAAPPPSRVLRIALTRDGLAAALDCEASAPHDPYGVRHPLCTPQAHCAVDIGVETGPPPCEAVRTGSRWRWIPSCSPEAHVGADSWLESGLLSSMAMPATRRDQVADAEQHENGCLGLQSVHDLVNDVRRSPLAIRHGG